MPEVRFCEPGALLFVKWDYRGMPLTHKTKSGANTRVTPSLRTLWRAMIKRELPTSWTDADFDHDWAGFTRKNAGFTPVEDPRLTLAGLCCGGEMLKAVTGLAIKQFIEVYAVDPQHPKYSDFTWFRPTIGKGGKVTPWPQFDGNGMMPFVGPKGRQWVRMSDVRVVGRMMHPFDPPNPEITMLGL